MTPTRLRLLAVAVFASAAVGLAADPPADDLKAAALKLNDLADEKEMQAKLTALIKDKAGTKKLVAAAAKAQVEGAKAKEAPFKYNAALVLAKAAHAVKDYDAAGVFYEFAGDHAAKLNSGPKMLASYQGLMAVRWQQKKYADVEAVARKLVDAPGGAEFEAAKPFALERLIQAKAKQGDTDEALNMAEGLIQLDRGGFYFVQLKGWVLREAGKTDDAIATYKEAIDKIDDNKRLPADAKTGLKQNFRYVLSALYVDKKDTDKAEGVLRELLKEVPDSATFHNDMGFVMADAGRNLDEAEKLVRKALELDAAARKKLLADKKIDEDEAKHENGSYVDSLGWVLFKKGKLSEAVKLLEQAANDEDEGQQLEIWDHLADALAAADRKAEAVAAWEKALKLADSSRRDGERRRAVTAKLNKLKAELKK